MIDINFYMKVSKLKADIDNGKKFDVDECFDFFESCRSYIPVLYNIETDLKCNMLCEMCPRTTMMTRKMSSIDPVIFRKIVNQITPWSSVEWSQWCDFVESYYNIKRNDMSENHFFLYVIPKVVVLHGYNDPLLDNNMPDYVKYMSEREVPSYFSCNPANIDFDRTIEVFESGLEYIKYSIESVDDEKHKEIRGNASNFTTAYKKILELINEKDRRGLGTTIIITMLDLNKESQEEEFEKLKEKFEGIDVYIYLKSQDQQWYQDKNNGTNSIHWQEFCQFPWSSMTIKSNGEACQCVEDFNNEIVLGDVNKQMLVDIWNSKKYRDFRWKHFNLDKEIKCTKQCDMHLIGEYCNEC